jgi:hypothetical protein
MVGKLALSTPSVLFAHLRAILAAAVDDERIAKNPCSVKSVKQPQPVQRKVIPWKITEVAAIRAGWPNGTGPSWTSAPAAAPARARSSVSARTTSTSTAALRVGQLRGRRTGPGFSVNLGKV